MHGNLEGTLNQRPGKAEAWRGLGGTGGGEERGEASSTQRKRENRVINAWERMSEGVPCSGESGGWREAGPKPDTPGPQCLFSSATPWLRSLSVLRLCEFAMRIWSSMRQMPALSARQSRIWIWDPEKLTSCLPVLNPSSLEPNGGRKGVCCPALPAPSPRATPHRGQGWCVVGRCPHMASGHRMPWPVGARGAGCVPGRGAPHEHG